LDSDAERTRLYDAAATGDFQSDLIEAATRPHIISVGEELASILKRQPDLIHTLSPRRYEEVVAELLRDMGWDVAFDSVYA